MQPGRATTGPAPQQEAAPAVRKGRPGVIVLIAFVVELVAIGALANEVVTKHLLNYATTHHDRFTGHLVAAFTTYQWRVSAQPGDRANEPLAHACLILVVLALTALLVFAVCRGPVTFGRAFLGTWMAVVVSTLAGQVIFDLVSPPPYPPGFTHASGAVFTGPDGFGFMAGLMLGLVTAVFASIFAVATRRTVRPAAAPYPGQYAGDQYGEQSREDEYAGHPWSDQTLAYPQADYSRSGFPQGDQQGYQQPYGQPYNQPYSGSYYAGQVGAPGAGGPGVAGAEATQQIAAMPGAEQSNAPSTDQPSTDQPSTDEPTQAIAVPPSERESAAPADAGESAAAPSQGGSAASADAGESAGSSEPPQPQAAQFPRPPEDDDLGQHPEQHDL